MANGTFQKAMICGYIGSDPVLRTTQIYDRRQHQHKDSAVFMVKY